MNEVEKGEEVNKGGGGCGKQNYGRTSDPRCPRKPCKIKINICLHFFLSTNLCNILGTYCHLLWQP